MMATINFSRGRNGFVASALREHPKGQQSYMDFLHHTCMLGDELKGLFVR